MENSTPAVPLATDNLVTRFNQIYFFGEVTVASIASLMQTLNGLLSGPYKDVELFVCTEGGLASPTLAFADFLDQRFPLPVTGIATGVCASAGTLMVSACAKRLITASSLFAVHQPSGGTWGKSDDVADEAIAMAKLLDIAVSIYARRNVKLAPREINDLLKRTRYMTAVEALENGFVDDILA